ARDRRVPVRPLGIGQQGPGRACEGCPGEPPHRHRRLPHDHRRVTARRGPADRAGGSPADVARELADLDAVLAELDVPYDEWEVLYRMRLQVERDLRAGKPVGEAFP